MKKMIAWQRNQPSNLRFLDAENCLALLPPVHELPMAQLLDEYLQRYVNDVRGELHGSVDALIRHNEKTANQTRGAQRLCNSPIEIALIYNVTNREIDVQGLKKPLKGPANFHTILMLENGITWKTIVPLQFILKGWGDANRGHQCYVHSISHNISQIKSYSDMLAREAAAVNDYHYVGITGRNWLHRFREHMGEMGRGSRRWFHRAWRKSMGVRDVHFASQLQNINLTYKEAMNWEEFHVDRLGSNRLNMIPGGFKGLKHLYKHRITNRMNVSLEERDKAIAEYARLNPRKGIPNLFITELWKDDEFYLKINEARSDRLSADQVRKIRELARMGWSVSDIKKDVNARNERQVKDVITGKYYGRIH